MIDDLELAFDERTEKGQHRRGGVRDRKRKGRGGRGKTVLALVLPLVLLAVLGGGVWYAGDRIQGLFGAPDYEGAGTGQVVIEIKDGDFLADIGNTLVTQGVVKSPKAFVEAAEKNSAATGIQPGFYQVRKQMSGESALTLLLDPKTRVTNKITIREGLTAKQVYKQLEETTKIPVAEFEAAAKDPLALGVPDYWFTRSDGKKVTPSIEGFLFPDTYDLPPNATAEGILKEMVQGFLTVVGQIKFTDVVQENLGGVTPYEALIVASLAQVEAGNPDDLGKVARVAYNRLFKPNSEVPCECFEMDVTVNYWFDVRGLPTKASKDMTTKELDDPKNPYNRKLKGFIPTPIDNPGKLALQGAMDPPKGDWYFFVAVDKQGHSEFAETNAQHLRNQQKARENGVL
ncbi:endolytic transglycosylase MltG [Micromonospora sp. NBC_01796]|uniref:endolytic transglycosylase MltG n=1 Tax=Micromonospora sp. NBC_01796 TaxID=2975987 RepID=UPI002DD89519|nr:endolytic transglycosylase MltG [Micromonospora sp. NBC_01796]WSA86129.1 endolytic transglycosylase MltG [Micromonospora sp. NBC_01796]